MADPANVSTTKGEVVTPVVTSTEAPAFGAEVISFIGLDQGEVEEPPKPVHIGDGTLGTKSVETIVATSLSTAKGPAVTATQTPSFETVTVAGADSTFIVASTIETLFTERVREVATALSK